MPPTWPCHSPLLLLLLLACQVSPRPPASASRCPHVGGPAQPLPVLTLHTLPTCPGPQPQAPSAQVMDFLLEKWKLYGDQCLHNLSLLPPPTGEPRSSTWPSLGPGAFLSSCWGKALVRGGDGVMERPGTCLWPNRGIEETVHQPQSWGTSCPPLPAGQAECGEGFRGWADLTWLGGAGEGRDGIEHRGQF